MIVILHVASPPWSSQTRIIHLIRSCDEESWCDSNYIFIARPTNAEREREGTCTRDFPLGWGACIRDLSFKRGGRRKREQSEYLV